MAFCDNCGMELAENAKFCENCGAPRMQAISESVSEREQMTQEAGFAGSQHRARPTIRVLPSAAARRTAPAAQACMQRIRFLRPLS